MVEEVSPWNVGVGVKMSVREGSLELCSFLYSKRMSLELRPILLILEVTTIHSDFLGVRIS